MKPEMRRARNTVDYHNVPGRRDNGRVASFRLALFVCAIVLCAFSTVPTSSICFHDIAKDAGLRFTLENNPTPEKHMIETMPGGVAVFDYDGDGRPDIFFTNGASVPSLKKNDPKFYNRLFRNEGAMKFRDVSAEAGLAGEGYSMGAAAGDFDNDGKPDLFVTGVYHNTLYRNLGGGKFEDVTAKSGIKSNEWSVAAGWFDFDNDGLLDLLVVNYGSWSADKEHYCGDQTRNLRIYCHPKYYDARPNQLYRNRGDGTFEDVSEKSGIAAHHGRGMGVAFADYDHDGKLDAFVTNDNMPNFLFHNLGAGKFEEIALVAGAALLDNGKPVASMGTEFADYNNDGWPDIIVVALNRETFPLFQNDKHGGFKDATYASKLASLTMDRGGWGPVLADFDNDGWKDLFTSNAHVNDIVERFEPATFKQANSTFVNLRNGQFGESPCEALKASVRAHRGVAAADFDGDGKLDVVVSALGEPAELWKNVSPGANHWLLLKLKGVKSNRDGIGAVVRVGDQTYEMSASTGYASSNLTGIHIGLGGADRVSSMEVRWSSGAVQVLKDIAADHMLTIQEK
jgi:hypothetical protein